MQLRTIKFLRVALPIAIVLFLLLIGFSYRKHTGRRAGPLVEPVVSPVRPGKPEVVSEAFDDTQTIAGRIVSRIRARRVIGLQGGWYTLEDVHVTVFREHGGAYEIYCDQAQFQRETRQAEIRGRVRLQSTDGLELSTDTLAFDGDQLTNHAPVAFRIGQWSGSAGGARVSVSDQMLLLTDGVRGRFAPIRPGELPVDFNASGASFDRAKGEGSFVGGVNVTRPLESLHADSVKLRLDQIRGVLVDLQGLDNVVLHLARTGAQPSKDETLGVGEATINAQRFLTEFGPDGEFSAFQVIGDTVPAHALFVGPPRRELSAKTIRAALQDAQVREIRADGAATLQELGPVPRVLSAEQLTVFLDAVTRQPASAVAQKSFHYRDPKSEAMGERATYDIPTDRVVLTAEAGSAPTIVSEGAKLKANVIEASPKAGVIRANGSVFAMLPPQRGGAAANDAMLFPNAEAPVYVNADSASLRQSNKLAIFSGNVRAWQDMNSLFCSDLEVQGAGEQIRAHGNARAILYNAQPGKKEPLLARGDTMVGKKSERRLEVTGNVEISDEGRTMKGEQAVFFFDAKRKLERVEAFRNLSIVEKATGRKGTGEKAVYRLAQRQILLDGSPATVTDPTGAMKGHQIVFDLASNKVDVVSGSGQTEGTYNPK